MHGHCPGVSLSRGCARHKSSTCATSSACVCREGVYSATLLLLCGVKYKLLPHVQSKLPIPAVHVPCALRSFLPVYEKLEQLQADQIIPRPPETPADGWLNPPIPAVHAAPMPPHSFLPVYQKLEQLQADQTVANTPGLCTVIQAVGSIPSRSQAMQADLTHLLGRDLLYSLGFRVKHVRHA